MVTQREASVEVSVPRPFLHVPLLPLACLNLRMVYLSTLLGRDPEVPVVVRCRYLENPQVTPQQVGKSP